MCFIQRKRQVQALLSFLCVFLVLCCVFLRPAVAAQGVLQGLTLCYQTVIPALFPILILVRLLLSGSASQILGLLLYPFVRLLGIKSKKASAAVLLGLVGGFCGGAKAIDTLYEQNEISAAQAQLLLCCTINAGLGFVVSGIGGRMLGSVAAGWLLFAALSVSSLVCGFAAKLFLPSSPTSSPALSSCVATPKTGFVAAVQGAVDATMMLCGFVVFFSFLIAILTPQNASSYVVFGISLPLEVTLACKTAAQSLSSMKLYACCAAISCMGMSVFAQVRALVSDQISVLPLLLSRLLHLPLSCALLYMLLRLFPIAISASATYTPLLRMPYGALTAVFLLCATFFCIFPTKTIYEPAKTRYNDT